MSRSHPPPNSVIKNYGDVGYSRNQQKHHDARYGNYYNDIEHKQTSRSDPLASYTQFGGKNESMSGDYGKTSRSDPQASHTQFGGKNEFVSKDYGHSSRSDPPASHTQFGGKNESMSEDYGHPSRKYGPRDVIEGYPQQRLRGNEEGEEAYRNEGRGKFGSSLEKETGEIFELGHRSGHFNPYERLNKGRSWEDEGEASYPHENMHERPETMSVEGSFNPYESLNEGRERQIGEETNYPHERLKTQKLGHFNPYESLNEGRGRQIEQETNHPHERLEMLPPEVHFNPYESLNERRIAEEMNNPHERLKTQQVGHFNPYESLNEGKGEERNHPHERLKMQHLFNPYESLNEGRGRQKAEELNYPHERLKTKQHGHFNPYESLKLGKERGAKEGHFNPYEKLKQPNWDDFEESDPFENVDNTKYRNSMTGEGEERRGSRWDEVAGILPSQMDIITGTMRFRGTLRHRYKGYSEEGGEQKRRISVHSSSHIDEDESEGELVEMLEKLREQPWSMEKRRKARKDLMAKLAYKEVKWYSTRPVTTAVKKGTIKLSNLLSGSYFWDKILKPLEGRHGSSVVAVFNFLRAMITLDLLLALILLLGVVVPGSILAGKQQYQGYGWIDPGGCQNRSIDICTDLTLENNTETLECNKNYTSYLKAVEDQHRNKLAGNIQDFLQGTGFLEWTVLFSGYYPASVDRDGYHISLAYILSVLSVYFVSLLAVVYMVAKFLRQSPRLKHSPGLTYSRIAFTGWDFAISESRAAKTQRNMIISEIKAAFDDETFTINKKNRTKKDWVELYLVRIIINLFVIVITFGAWTGIYFLVKEAALHTSAGFFERFLWQYLPIVTISGINLIYPIIFSTVVSFEYYRGRTELLVTLFRSVTIRLTSLAILIGVKIDLISKQSPTCDAYGTGYICWETQLGQQLYSVLILDFIIQLGITFVLNLARKFLGRFENSLCQKLSHMEFDVPGHVLDIVYIQSILWLSVVYAPLMAFVCWLYFLVLFLLKMFTISVTCVRPTRVFRASSSSAMFMTVLCLALALCGTASGVGLFHLCPSKACSPFRGLGNTWDVITFYICRIDGNSYWIRWILFSLDDMMLLGLILIILVMLLVYYVSKAKARYATITLLEKRLRDTAKDKAYLVNHCKKPIG